MQLDLGNKIRQLRHRDGRTQEALAEALGVTPQAVSRWEANGSYPDMNLIPSIANYFGVTIDELFGYENDRERRIDALVKEIDEMNDQNSGHDVNISECIALARSALVEFPGNEKLMISLASALFKAGYVRHGECHSINVDGYSVYDAALHRTYAEWNEAVALYEKVLETVPSGKLRDRAMDELSQLYLNLGEYEKGKALAESAPSVWNSREVMRAYAFDGKQGVKASGEALLSLIRACAQLIIGITTGDQQHLSAHDKAENIAGAIRLFHVVCADGNLGRHHAYVSSLELLLSAYLWLDERKDEAFATLESARENFLKFIKVVETGVARYSAPMVRLAEEGLPCDIDLAWQDYRTTAEDWPWYNIPEKHQVKAEMQQDPRWAQWVAKLQE